MYVYTLVAQLVKNLPAVQETQFDSWVRKIRWRRDRLPTPVFLGFNCGSAGKESACNVGDLGSILGLGRSPGEGKGYPLQDSGLERSMDCIDHRVTKSTVGLDWATFTFTFSIPPPLQSLTIATLLSVFMLLTAPGTLYKWKHIHSVLFCFLKHSHESESEVAQLCPTLCHPVDCIAHQAPPSMGFPRQEYCNGLPFPSPGDLPHLGIEPRSPALRADALTSESPGKPHSHSHRDRQLVCFPFLGEGTFSSLCTCIIHPRDTGIFKVCKHLVQI